MSNILSNLMTSIFSNIITIIFLVIIVAYGLFKFIENKNLYYHIKNDLDDLNLNYRNSKVYLGVSSKYQSYKEDNSYGEVNPSSFVEEVVSSFTYKNKYLLNTIKSIKATSANCILLGVLGTFVGLSMMLLSVDTSDMINSLPKTISSMQTAFTTSIFGIISSILMGFALKVHNCEHILLQLMLKLENIVTLESSNEKSHTMDTKIEEVKNTIKQISKSIEAIERFDKISKDLNDFNDEFISGIESLKDLLFGSTNSIKTFDQSVRRLDKQFGVLNMKFNKLFDKYEKQEDMNQEVLLEMRETSKNINKTAEGQVKVKEYVGNLNAIFGLYERSVQDLLNKLISHDEKIITDQRELKKSKEEIKGSVDELSQIINLASTEIGEKLQLMFNYIDIYNEAINYNKENTLSDSLNSDEEIYEIEEESDEDYLLEFGEIYTRIKDIDEDDLDD